MSDHHSYFSPEAKLERVASRYLAFHEKRVESDHRLATDGQAIVFDQIMRVGERTLELVQGWRFAQQLEWLQIEKIDRSREAFDGRLPVLARALIQQAGIEPQTA